MKTLLVYLTILTTIYAESHQLTLEQAKEYNKNYNGIIKGFTSNFYTDEFDKSTKTKSIKFTLVTGPLRIHLLTKINFSLPPNESKMINIFYNDYSNNFRVVVFRHEQHSIESTLTVAKGKYTHTPWEEYRLSAQRKR